MKTTKIPSKAIKEFISDHSFKCSPESAIIFRPIMNPDELDFLRNLKKEESQNVGLKLVKSLDDRSLGHLRHNVKANEDRKLFSEEEFIRKEKFDELRCEMPGTPRSTFLMVFSPDGTKVASTHGNHNIYVTDLRSGKNVKTLVGHPRTPWCIAFHPTSNQIVASGCLGGQVRIWDLSGGSEVWTASNQSVIASIAFHPVDRVLVIATFNEVYFWDWSQPEPFCHTATGNQKEKVRYVAFDKLGHKLITGISNSQNRWDYVRSTTPIARQPERIFSPHSSHRIACRILNFGMRSQNNAQQPHQAQQQQQQPPPPPPPPIQQQSPQPQPSSSNNNTNTTRELLSSVPERERNITMCYRNLVREYGRLVQRYLQLYRPPAMIDRGTDPMEPSTVRPSSSSSTQVSETSANNSPPTAPEIPSTSSQEHLPSANRENPYRLFTPSRILAAMNRPTTLKRGTQTTETRKHKAKRGDSSNEESGGKKMKKSEETSVQTSDGLEAPGPSRIRDDNISEDTEKNETSPNLKIKDELFEISRPSCKDTRQRNEASASTASLTDLLSSSSNSSSATSSKGVTRSGLIDFLNKIPKRIEEAIRDSSRSDDSSSSDEQEMKKGHDKVKTTSTSLKPNEHVKGEENKESSTQTEVAPHEETARDEGQIDYATSMPGPSRETTEENPPINPQKWEILKMNMRRNAEEKLWPKVLPLIRSAPENDRLKLIRHFEQGLKEGVEKFCLEQVLNKKPVRRPVLDTSSDTTSSEDESDPLHINFFNQRGQSGGGENSQGPSEPIASTSRGGYHDINSLENWVSSLFDDIEPNTSTDNNRGTTTQTTTTTSTSTTIDSLLDRPFRSHRLQSLRNRLNARLSSVPTMMSTAQSLPSAQSSTSLNTSARMTNYSLYSSARRRLGTHRASAFHPTRIYHPRNAMRNRYSSFLRSRLNNRPASHAENELQRSRTIPNILNNDGNASNDTLINFSELPNSEDDPVPTSSNIRSSTPLPYMLYNFHPFNPPPDLPTINPENIGIGNMYSNIVQDLETSLNDVRNIRATNRPGEMSGMLSTFSERLENIMNQSETILRNLRTSVEMLPNERSQESTEPTATFNDPNFYVRDNRNEENELERSLFADGIPPNIVNSDHTYPRNSESSASSSGSSDTMSPLMTSLHLTISHIQRQARLLRQQVESIEIIDRAMVEVAQLQLMRLLLVELSRYFRNMSGESRSTCMSSVRQMMAGTRISDSSPSESPSNDNEDSASSQPQPSTSSENNIPSARTRGMTHKTYPPSRLIRLQRHHYRRTAFHHVPRRYALRLPPRNVSNLWIPPISLNFDSPSMLHMYSRINNFTLNQMRRELEELISEQVRIFTQRSFVRVPPRMPGGNMGEQNLANRLRDSITRTNRLVGSIFDANIVRNYQMETTAVTRDGVDRFYARQTLSFIIDGISTHLDEIRGSYLTHNIRLHLKRVLTISMLLSELLLLHIVDSIPPPTDMNLDQERQSLTNRIDHMCTTMMLSNRYEGYSSNLTHSLRQLQAMIRQNTNQSNETSSFRRRTMDPRNLDLRPRSVHLHRSHMLLSRMRNTLRPIPTRVTDQETSNQETETQQSETNQEESNRSRMRIPMASRIRALRRMRNNLYSLHYADQSHEPDNTDQTVENLDLQARVLEARTRAFFRMSNSLQSRHADLSEQSAAQNSESDDNPPRERFTSNPGPSSESSAWNPWTEGNRQENNEPSSSYRPFNRLHVRSPAQPSSNNSEEWPRASRWPWNVPSVQVNDVPVAELGPSQDSSESDNAPNLGNNNNNSYPTRDVMARLAAIRAVNHPMGVFRPRFLHPLYASVNPFDADLDDPQREHIYDSDVITTVTPNHRIQVWDISDSIIPSISNPLKNVVVCECKIHNDASVDIASDGSILVTLLPSGGYLNVTNRLGVYSLKWETLGQCLYTTNFDHNAVSVSLSPLGKHLVVGLASRRVSIVPSERWMMARIFKIEQKDVPGDRLPVVRELDQSRDGRATSYKSVNCIRWLPTSGQGLIYATNTGQLVIWT